MVDELDTRLHPWILRELISRFHDKKNRNAQLIFSAHNTIALNTQDMHMDEVYFVRKDDKGHSTIERLFDSTVSGDEMDMEFGKAYLAGRFGAVPERFVLSK